MKDIKTEYADMYDMVGYFKEHKSNLLPAVGIFGLFVIAVFPVIAFWTQEDVVSLIITTLIAAPFGLLIMTLKRGTRLTGNQMTLILCLFFLAAFVVPLTLATIFSDMTMTFGSQFLIILWIFLLHTYLIMDHQSRLLKRVRKSGYILHSADYIPFSSVDTALELYKRPGNSVLVKQIYTATRAKKKRGMVILCRIPVQQNDPAGKDYLSAPSGDTRVADADVFLPGGKPDTIIRFSSGGVDYTLGGLNIKRDKLDKVVETFATDTRE